jgi:UDP-hydrolysing UDP-N-acetyl-D-glucosamine 2-epimerase
VIVRRIAVFTSSRADLGPLGPVIEMLDADPGARLVVIATGTHSARAFGGRLGEMRVSAGSAIEVVDAEIGSTDPSALADAHARIASGVSRVLASNVIDVIVLLGDRWELLAAASAALLHGVPIAHLHGGETTEGAIDERVRHAITKLADLHLCATVDSARRIRRLGEEPWRIVVTGAPGLDRVGRTEPMTVMDVEHLAGTRVVPPFGVLVYHPPTIDRVDIARRARAVLEATANELGLVLVLYPGADPGSQSVIEEIRRAASRYPNVVASRNLGDRYLPLLKVVDVLVGNSSSGIIEAASFGLPVVDVGDRQQGRLHPPNVVHVGETENEIRNGIARALSRDFRDSLAGLENPYGDGSAAKRVVRALLDVPLERLLSKPFIRLVDESMPLDSMTIPATASLRDALAAIERGASQIALVTDRDGLLTGTIVDGDVRRALLGGATLDSPIAGHATLIPVVASPSDDPDRILEMMQQARVTQVPVVDDDGRLVGLHMMRAIVGDLSDRAGSRSIGAWFDGSLMGKASGR